MDSLNYRHLQYFWAVARGGSIKRASEELYLTPQTISAQVSALERHLGEKLFLRSGRRLVLTETGHVVLRYADEIFNAGRELIDTLKGQPTGRPMRFLVGATDVLPKLIVYRLLEPAFLLREPVHVVCREGKPGVLLVDLAVHKFNVVLSDTPIPPDVKIRAFNHLLGECGVTFMATRKLAATFRKGFPRSLNGAPVLLPTEDTTLRRSLEHWFHAKGIRPHVVAEFEDSALLKVFGQAGMGIFPVQSIISKDVQHQYKVDKIGKVEGVIERFYAITLDRKVRHPAVAAICDSAKKDLFE